MSKSGFRVEVVGLDDLRRELRGLEADARRELRQVNKEAAEVVAEETRRLAPKRSGKLRDSVRAFAGQKEAGVKVGTPARVPYAGPVNYGHGPPRAQGGYVKGQQFIQRAVGRKIEKVRDLYDSEINRLAKKRLG